MSLETELKRLADAAERIADGLGVLATLEGGFRSIDPPEGEVNAGKPEAETESNSTEEPSTEESSSSSPTEPESPSGDAPTKEDVRDALKELQGRTDAGTARKLLKDHGAKTLTDLPEDKYAEVIEAANSAGV